MKNTVITILIILGLLATGVLYFQSKFSYVTKEHFDQAHEILNEKIDSLRAQLDNVQTTVNIIELNTDTLKTSIEQLQQGQEVIYDEVKSITKSEKTFWQKLKEL